LRLARGEDLLEAIRTSGIETNPKYSAEVTLRDGAKLLIRAIRPDDKPRLVEHFNTLSPESRYFRFMGTRRELTDDDLRRFTELDFIDQVGLVVADSRAGHERFVGIGRYSRERGAPRAEVAFAVLDQFQGHGVGTLLLQHLATIARRSGIDEFVATVMGSNRRMLEVFINCGLPVHQKDLDGTVEVSIRL